jgi:hypothetical protein
MYQISVLSVVILKVQVAIWVELSVRDALNERAERESPALSGLMRQRLLKYIDAMTRGLCKQTLAVWLRAIRNIESWLVRHEHSTIIESINQYRAFIQVYC